MTGRIPFTSEPKIGVTMMIDQQAFELIKKHVFRRQDGSTGTMLDWRAACADCGAAFVTSTSFGGATPTRRCRAHRRAAKQVVPGPRRKLSIKIIEPGRANERASHHTGASSPRCGTAARRPRRGGRR